ncbi:MAG: FCD domain-containing protein [Gemmataceae bacterium]|nr:FCD domain-containing protein [Gemmataceae bacterium]
MISLEEGTTVAFGHEHCEIVQAIQTGDSAAAEMAMRKHIDELIAVVGGYRTCHERPAATARDAGGTGRN